VKVSFQQLNEASRSRFPGGLFFWKLAAHSLIMSCSENGRKTVKEADAGGL
jgi:hypothetical protein